MQTDNNVQEKSFSASAIPTHPQSLMSLNNLAKVTGVLSHSSVADPEVKSKEEFIDRLEAICGNHNNVLKEQSIVKGLSKRKASVYHVYNENRTFIPQWRWGSMEKSDESKVVFPPSYFLYAVAVTLFFCLPVGLYAIYQSRRV